MSNWMMKAEVEEIPHEECLHNYTSQYQSGLRYVLPTDINETQICAKNRTGPANTCQGKTLIFPPTIMIKISDFQETLGQV